MLAGLWLADLTITQLFLETILEKERGIVLGVQTSLNQLMDMLKFAMVIVAPQPELFGILVLISFAFVCNGFLLYAKYVYSVRGQKTQLYEKITVVEPLDSKTIAKDDVVKYQNEDTEYV